MDEQDLIRKVGLLLKKAEGTDNEHEATAFYEAAQRLMLQYAIDEARVREAQRALSGKRVEEPVVEDYMFSSYAHHAKAKTALMEIVAKHQHVRCFTYGNRKFSNRDRVAAAGQSGLHESQWTKLVGYKSDIENMKLLYMSLLIQSQKLAAEDWRRRYGKGKFSDEGLGKFMWLSGHMEGFADRIGERFRELAEVIYSEVKDGKELISNKDADILEWMYEHSLLRRPSPPVYHCWTPEPESNRPLTKAGTPSKKWEPLYCVIVKPSANEPHEGDHKFTYRPYKVALSYYTRKGRTESYEGKRAGRSAADRADIGLSRISGQARLSGGQ